MFIAYVRQEHDGCDYTIGCGQVLWLLKAPTREDARVEIKKMVLGEWLPEYDCYEGGCWDEISLRSVVLYEVSNEEDMPIGPWYCAAREHIRKSKLQTDADKEKAEYERLKAKFEEAAQCQQKT